VLVPDITAAAETRWPAFAGAISDTPVRAMYVFPLRVGARGLGVLNVYRDIPGVLDLVGLAAGLRAADMLVLALLDDGLEETTLMGTDEGNPGHGGEATNDVRGDGTDIHYGGWSEATYHAEVHQATGMITAQAGIDAAAALARLRAASFAGNTSIEELALDVLARRVRFEPDGA
jgi:hypothetical protein